MKPIRVNALAPEQLDALEELCRTTRDARLRTRAQMVLLAAERRLVAEVDRRDRACERGDGEALAQALPGRGSRGLAPCAASGRAAQGDPGVSRAVGAGKVRHPRSLGQPFSLWTLRRLADYMAEREQVSPSGVGDRSSASEGREDRT